MYLTYYIDFLLTISCKDPINKATVYSYYFLNWYEIFFDLSLPVPIVDEEKKKLSEVFIFTLLCGALKAFIKPLEALQRSVKLRII